MKYLLSKQLRIVLLILIPILVSFACLPDGSPTGDLTAEAVVPAGAVTAQADMVFSPGAFNLLDTTAGLASLPSYKATLTISFDGIRDGQPSQWSKTYVMLTRRDTNSRQLTLEKTGDLSDLDVVIMVEADGATYEKRGENACTATVIEEGNSLSEQLEPAGLLNGVIGAEEAEAETVNDIASDKYTFDESAFGQSDIAQSTGEIWVASEGGYIVKYLLTTKGDADYFGEGIEGTLIWNYELTDINVPITFALPDDCPAGMVNAPLLPDAADVVNMPSLLTYTTVTSLADVAAFYQEQIPILGWTLLGEPTISDTAMVLTYTQGDQNLTVIITTDAGLTTVTILLERLQEF